MLDAHDPDAFAAVGVVVALEQAQDRRHPAADLAVEPGGVVAGAAEVLHPVGAVARLADQVGALLALDERGDPAPAGAEHLVLDRPALGAKGVEDAAHGLVVDAEAELLVAGGDGVHDVVAVEEEDDRRQREHGDDALGRVDQAGEDGEHDEAVHRQEGEREGDGVQGRAAGGGPSYSGHDPSIGRSGPLA